MSAIHEDVVALWEALWSSENVTGKKSKVGSWLDHNWPVVVSEFVSRLFVCAYADLFYTAGGWQLT